MSKNDKALAANGLVNDYQVSIPSSIIQHRDELLETATFITVVENTDDQTAARSVAAQLKDFCGKVEKTRKELTAPLLKAQKLLISTADHAVLPAQLEVKRLERALADFHLAQEHKRLEAERAQARKEQEAAAARQAELNRIAELERQRLQAECDAEQAKTAKARAAAAQKAADIEDSLLAASLAADMAPAAPAYVPPPVVEKPKGAAVQKIVKFEITDAKALFEKHPEFFELTPIVRTINYFLATPGADRNLPGLRVWEETKVSVRSAEAPTEPAITY